LLTFLLVIFINAVGSGKRGRKEGKREKEGEGGRESKIVKTERKRGFGKVLESS
jgi:hypothetical protein